TRARLSFAVNGDSDRPIAPETVPTPASPTTEGASVTATELSRTSNDPIPGASKCCGGADGSAENHLEMSSAVSVTTGPMTTSALTDVPGEGTGPERKSGPLAVVVSASATLIAMSPLGIGPENAKLSPCTAAV